MLQFLESVPQLLSQTVISKSRTDKLKFCMCFSVPLFIVFAINLKKQNKDKAHFICSNPKEKIFKYSTKLIPVGNAPGIPNCSV